MTCVKLDWMQRSFVLLCYRFLITWNESSWYCSSCLDSFLSLLLNATLWLDEGIILTSSPLVSSVFLAESSVQDHSAAPRQAYQTGLHLFGRAHAKGPQEETAGGRRHGDHRLCSLWGRPRASFSVLLYFVITLIYNNPSSLSLQVPDEVWGFFFCFVFHL